MMLWFLLIALCDVYPVSAPDDFLITDFSVAQSPNDFGTGCVDASFTNGPASLTIPLREPIDPPGEPVPSQMILTPSRPENSASSLVVPMIPPEPPGKEPYFYMTPEPAAIIVISGLLLITLLFGRQRRAY